MKKYIIKVNDIQALSIIEATDFESRLISGQLNEILLKVIPLSKNVNRDKIRYLLDELKMEMFPELDHNESYGIFNKKTDEKAKVLYDIHQVIRYKYSWSKNPKGGIERWFDDPMRTSNEELPVVNEYTS